MSAPHGVAEAQVDAGRERVDVAARPRVRERVELDRGHLRGRHLDGERDGHGTGAGAEVDDDGRAPGRRDPQRLVDGEAGHHLRLGPRHEDAGTDGELDGAEPGPAGEVLQRHALRTRGDELLQPCRRDRVEDEATNGRRGDLAGAQAEGVGGEPVGVRAGGGHARGSQAVPCRAQENGELGQRVASASASARRAASSASTLARTTGSRSPSSTWSRL